MELIKKIGGYVCNDFTQKFINIYLNGGIECLIENIRALSICLDNILVISFSKGTSNESSFVLTPHTCRYFFLFIILYFLLINFPFPVKLKQLNIVFEIF